MSEGPARLVAQHVHDLIERQRLDALPDYALLGRFLAGDDRAFAALVRRHGPLVLGACRRILRHAQDAEDACQATFLVLARKGGTVRGGDSLAGWLHRVAVRAANRLRRGRRIVEPLATEPHAPGSACDGLDWCEVRATFDAEVGRLPDRFRLPLVLCCLQGKTRAQAAAELGWSEGAVRGRLERGRKLLRSRFTRKGLTLPAALLPLLVEQATTAAAPSTAAARLADGLVRSMALARARLAAWATAAVLVAGTAIGLGVYGPAAAQPKPAETPPATPDIPAAKAADAERNLDTFVLRVSLAPAGEGKFDAKYSLYHVLLYVPNLRLEPPANGPDGKPTEAHARITREQAGKILVTLRGFDFFEDDKAFQDPVKAKLQVTDARHWPHVGIAVRFQNGEDPNRRERLLAWLPSMLRPLDAIRECVDGEAAKALDRLLGQLAETRKKWGPNPLAEDLKNLQGAWAIDPKEFLDRDGLTAATAKCTIDGKTITLKPRVQLDPLLDLETIRGTFELSEGSWYRQMTIKGVRDTVSKQEAGTWTALYQVDDSTLRLLLPPAGAGPPTEWKPARDRGDREFTLKKVPGLTSDWGESSRGVQTRIRSPKAKYAAGETPTLDLDVRDMHAGVAGKPWHWLAPKIARLARVEVDRVWYRAPEEDPKSRPAYRLMHGETVERWMTVALTEKYWRVEATDDVVPRPLVLPPGKHGIRIQYTYIPSEAGLIEATPVSGPAEIEILPRMVEGHPSDWGEPSRGVSTRIRTAMARYAAGEAIKLELDVKATGDGGPKPAVWRAARNSSPARIEFGGVWYRRVPAEVGKVLTPTLTAGEQVDRWATLNLSDDWVAEYFTGIPPEQVAQRLKLPPGKHTIRVGFSFSSQTADAVPISGPLELEIVDQGGK